MCPQASRLIIVVTLLVVAMLYRQQCLSAALKQKEVDENNGDDDNLDFYGDHDIEDGYEYRVRRSSEKNLTHVPERDSGFVTQATLMDFEKNLRMLRGELKAVKSQVLGLERFISKMESEDCKYARCVTGAMKYGCDCLLYVHTKKTWDEAVQYCQDMTGKLVAIRSERLQRNIKRFLKAQLGKRGLAKTQVYTGLIYTHPKNRKPSFTGGVGSGLADGWYWHDLPEVSLTPLDEHLAHWGKDQPDRSDIFPRSCMHLNGTDRFRWYSTYCTVPMNFICHFASVPRERDRRHRKHSRNASGKGGNCRSKKKKRRGRDGRGERCSEGSHRERDRDGHRRNHRHGKRSEGGRETLTHNEEPEEEEGGEKGRIDKDGDNIGGG